MTQQVGTLLNNSATSQEKLVSLLLFVIISRHHMFCCPLPTTEAWNTQLIIDPRHDNSYLVELS